MKLKDLLKSIGDTIIFTDANEKGGIKASLYIDWYADNPKYYQFMNLECYDALDGIYDNLGNKLISYELTKVGEQ